MLIVRPAIAADVHDLLELAEKAGEGMSSPKYDVLFLEKTIFHFFCSNQLLSNC